MVKFTTHSGVFHADDVFATAWLQRHFNNYDKNNFVRTNKVSDEDLDNPDVIVYDIGGKYDNRNNFDHHMRNDKPVRDNGYPLSSFGLVYRFFNNINNFWIWNEIESRLVIPIDLIDNGMINKNKELPEYSLSQAISSFNPVHEVSDEERNKAFWCAVDLAHQIINNEINYVIKMAEDREAVLASPIIEDEIIVFEKSYAGWQRHILENEQFSNIKYAIYPGLRGGYMIQCVPDEIGSFGMRMSLPEEWAGLRGEDLDNKTNIPGCTFVHPGKFIGGAETAEKCIEMAKLAISINNK